MNTKDIEQLIELLEKSSIAEIEVWRWGKKIRVSRSRLPSSITGARHSLPRRWVESIAGLCKPDPLWPRSGFPGADRPW